MLRIVLEKTVGHLRLPPHVRIIAAANPPSVAADGWDLAAPLANRFIHLQWQPTATDIATGFISGFPRFTSLKAVSPNAAQIAAAKTHIGTFLRVRPQLVSVIPDSPDRAGQAWPSPRTWEMAAIAVATSWANGAGEDVIATLLIGAVGEAAGFEALSWLKNLDLPDPETILRDPDGVALPVEVDRLHALLSAVVAVAVTELEEAELADTAAHDSDAARETWQRAWRVIARVARTTPDVAATAAQSLAQHRPAGAPLPAELLELAPILRRAGLMP